MNRKKGGYGYSVKRHFQQYVGYIVAVIPGENHRPVASH